MHPAAFTRILMASAVLFCFSPSTSAQSPYDIKSLPHRVAADSPLSYLNLAGEVFTDIPVDGDGESWNATRSRKLRRLLIACRSEKDASADTEGASLIRGDECLGKRRGLRAKGAKEQKQGAINSTANVERFAGALEVGKTYTSDFIFDERSGWRLALRIKTPLHHAARIEWIDKKRILPSLIKENRYRLEFKVLAKSVRQAGNSRRWNTTYKCAVSEAFILIPPKEVEF